MPDYIPTVFTSKATLLANIPTRIYQNFLRLITGTVHQQMDMDMVASLWREFTAPLVLDTATGVVKVTDGTASGMVWQWNAVTSAWFQVQAKTGKIIWVDGTYGADTGANAGQVYNPFRPYLTLDAAQTAASSGDLIHVRTGAYTTTGIGKAGVNWLFDLGATIAGPITDGTVAKTFSIAGQGVFTHTADAVSITKAASNVFIEAISITTTTGNAVYQQNSNTLRVRAILSGPTGAKCDGGTQYVTGNCTGSTGPGAHCNGGIQYVTGNISGTAAQGVLCSAGTQSIIGNVTAFSNGAECTSGSQAVRGNVTSTSSTSYGMLCNGGDQIVYGPVRSKKIGAWITAGTQTLYGDLYAFGGTGADTGVLCDGGVQTIIGNILGGTYPASCSAGSQSIHGNITNAGTVGLTCIGGLQVLYGNVNSGANTVYLTGGEQRVYGNMTGVGSMTVSGGTQLTVGNVTVALVSLPNLSPGGTCVILGDVIADITINKSTAKLRLGGKTTTTIPIQLLGGTLILAATARAISASGTYCAVGTGTGTLISYGAYATLIQDPALVFNGTLNVGAYVQ